jgi:hypothetical protein
VRRDTAASGPEAEHGGDTSKLKKVVTMRPVRILLVAIAVIAVALTGWAFGARGGYSQPGTSPTMTTEAPQSEPAAAPAPAPADPVAKPPEAPPVPRPRIFGFGSEPVLPTEGGFWQLPAGASLLTMVLDAPHATRVELWLTPTGTGDLARKIGQDTNGRDGWLFNWHYPEEPFLAHLTVKAIGPGGTAEHTVGIHHPDPASQP